ncbi:MscL family protein [Rudaeicoccus suwonensis]|uniref:Large conductance mechanosensitive channel n=1 Tax=Rudaeicoccus suwonensis TaxID=657409 RepID=A0A561E803_9MICO|nr:MscL family protein [Rudaeicoccus suwonensis]TWE11741.1 large conductance mechanosensitive channel [Rudaeicoccus suwonensis]
MQGFKKFVMQGNLVELAVAFIMATAFAAVVKALVAVIMDLIGKVGGTPNFSGYTPGGVHVGDFLTALIAFIFMAAVVYFLIVKPYEAAKERFTKEPDADDPTDTELSLLMEIRDELRSRDRG